MHAMCVEELPVYRRCLALMTAVFAVTPRFGSHRWLATQLNDSVESILANLSEGFAQNTDRAFARYVAIASGSAAECRAHLQAARMLGLLPAERCGEMRHEVGEILFMLHGFRAYLQRSDRKNRLTPSR